MKKRIIVNGIPKHTKRTAHNKITVLFTVFQFVSDTQMGDGIFCITENTF